MSKKLEMDLEFLQDQIKDILSTHRELLIKNPPTTEKKQEQLYQISFNLIQLARQLIEEDLNYYQLSISVSQIGSDLCNLSSTLSSLLAERSNQCEYQSETDDTNRSFPTTPVDNQSQYEKSIYICVPRHQNHNAHKKTSPRSATPRPIPVKTIDRPSFDELTVVYKGDTFFNVSSQETEQLDAQSDISISVHEEQRHVESSAPATTLTDHQDHSQTPIPQISPQRSNIQSRPRIGKIFIRRKKE